MIVKLSWCAVILTTLVSAAPSSSKGFPWQAGMENWDYYESYNKQMRCESVHPIQDPKTMEDVQKLVKWAISKNSTVKALGSRHTSTDLICTQGLPIFMTGIKHMRINAADSTVTVGAGAQLVDLLKFLDENGRGLIQVPTFAGITVGGAVATGVHGSSLTHPATISDQVVKMLIIDGTGTLRTIRNKEELKAFRVNLGLLGVVLEITLRTVPQYKVHLQNFKMTEDVFFNGYLLENAKLWDYFQFWWLPNEKSVVVAQGKYVGMEVNGTAVGNLIPDVPIWESHIVSSLIEIAQSLRKQPVFELLEEFSQRGLYQFIFVKPPFYEEEDKPLTFVNPAVGVSYKMMSNKCTSCPWDAGKLSVRPEIWDFAFEMNELPNVVQIVKDVLKEASAEFPLVSLYFRFGKSTDSYMAVENGQSTLHVEVALPARLDQFNTAKMGIDAIQAILQAWVAKAGARAHWAKSGLLYLSRDHIQKSFTHRGKFIKVMKKYDPNGLFGNDFSGRVQGIWDKTTVHPLVTHCALQDYCVCKVNSDCAPSQRCTPLQGYNVCRDRPGAPVTTWFSYILPSLNNIKLDKEDKAQYDQMISEIKL